MVRLPEASDKSRTTREAARATIATEVPKVARTIPHRELRNSSGEVLRQVQAGETIQVTNHGEVVAILTPPERPIVLQIRQASTKGGFADLPRTMLDRPAGDLLDELRSER
jgi:prevent-host-death family protein